MAQPCHGRSAKSSNQHHTAQRSLVPEAAPGRVSGPAIPLRAAEQRGFYKASDAKQIPAGRSMGAIGPGEHSQPGTEVSQGSRSKGHSAEGALRLGFLSVASRLQTSLGCFSIVIRISAQASPLRPSLVSTSK